MVDTAVGVSLCVLNDVVWIKVDLKLAQQEVEAERFLWGRPHKGIPGHYAED